MNNVQPNKIAVEVKPISNVDESRVEQNLIKNALKKSIRCRPDEYKIVFHSKSILLSPVIAEYLFQQLQIQKTTTLLINFYQQEIDQIFSQIVSKKSIELLRNPSRQTKVQLKRLNQIVKDKRSQYYKTAGVYSLSSQILIKDFLRFQNIIELSTIDRIVIRISQKITSYLNYYGWIFTVLKKQTRKCSVLIICRDVHYYTQFEALEGIYRTFFCEKLVIWPFGRAQIHKSIKRTSSKLNQLKHYLQMPEEMSKNEQILKGLLQIVQKQYNRFRTTKANALQILFKQTVSQSQNYSTQLHELRDFKNLKSIMNSVQNCDSIYLMTFILNLRMNENEKGIWNSSNLTVSQLLIQLQTNAKSKIYSFSKIQQTENCKKTNLVELIANFHYDRQQKQIAQTYHQWDAIYQLQYDISPSMHKNPKVLQTYEIVDKILEDLQNKHNITQNKHRTSQQKTQKINFQGKIQDNFDVLQDLDFQQKFETLVINCPSQSAKKYLHKQLFNKINNCHQVENLRSVYRFLQIQRQLRIVNIKSIYSKIRQKRKVQKIQIEQNFQGQEQAQKQKQQLVANKKLKQQSLAVSKSSFQMIQDIMYDQKNMFQLSQKGLKQQEVMRCWTKENQIQKQKMKNQIQPLLTSTGSLIYCCQLNTKNLKNKKSAKQIFRQNSIILEECLYMQLTILFQVLSRYQNQVYTQQQIKMNNSTVKHKDKTQTKYLNNSNSSKIYNHVFKKNQSVNAEYEDNTISNKNRQEIDGSVKCILRGQSQAFEGLFQQEISRINFNYLNKKQLKAVPNYLQRTQLCFYSKRDPGKKLLFVTLFSPKAGSSSDKVTQFNQCIRLVNPHRVLFYSPQTWQVRNLYISYSQGLLQDLKQISVLAFKGSFQIAAAEHQVRVEEEAFWKISQNRLRIAKYSQNPQMRIKGLQMNDKYQKTIDFINYAIKNGPKAQQKPHLYRLSLNVRRVIVDSREFKSALPCYLFFCGFTVIPIQLETADYILSDQIGIQKKSVQTKDLHQSLKSYRLDKQIKRMCQRFQKPYLLIQCQDAEEFKKQSFYEKGLQPKSKDSYKAYIRQRLAELMKKFPKLRIIWSDNVSRTCDFFKQLKRDQPQPQMGRYLKSQKQQLAQKIIDSDDSQDGNLQKQTIHLK